MTLRALIDELDALNRAYIESEGYRPDDRKQYELFPPAKAHEIATYEKSIGFELPRDYREFLKQHDGWRGFWGGMCLAGVRLTDGRDIHRDLAKRAKDFDGYIDEEDLEQEDDFVRGSQVFLFGTDFNGRMLAFDRARSGEVLEIGSPGCVDRRYASFESYLKRIVQSARKEAREVMRALAKQKAITARDSKKKASYRGKTFFVAGEIPADMDDVKRAVRQLGATLAARPSKRVTHVVMGKNPPALSCAAARVITYKTFRRILWY